jgi:uncharacterized protein (DUF2132 family)
MSIVIDQNFNFKNPLHGLSLEKILTFLVEVYGWEALYAQVSVRCFYNDPSVKSSLKFLRQNLWAREKVEKIFLDYVLNIQKSLTNTDSSNTED